MTARAASRSPRDETGAALVFALVIVTAIALVSGAILTHGSVNFRATVTLRSVAGTSYASDTAAKVAINHLRLGSSAPGFVQSTLAADNPPWVYSNNIDGTGCFGLEGTEPRDALVLPSIQPKAGRQAADTSARVECAVVPGTGLFGGGEDVTINGNLRAITVLGEEGLEVSDNSELQVRGSIASNGDIDADNAAGTALFTNGDIWANNGCTGTVRTTRTKDCAHAEVAAQPVTEVFTSTAGVPVRDARTESCTGFRGGFYPDAARLTAATTACGTAVFLPGDYYFGFDDESRSTGDNVWKITGTVIGGQAVGSGEPPGRCRNPIDDAGAQGVRFVFGGNSRLEIGQNARVELCGTYSASAFPVVVQQQQQSTASTTGTSTLAATTVDPAGSTPAWSPAPSAAMVAAIDSSAATWPGSTTGNPKGRLTLSAFGAAPAVPPGARLQSATLRVHHKEVGNSPIAVKISAGSTSYSASLPARGVTDLAQPYPVATADVLPDPTGAVTAMLSDAVRYGTLGSTVPTIEFSLDGKNKAMAIDSASLELTWTSWSLAAATDNTFISGFGDSFKGDFLMQGHVYAPNGLVQVDFGNNPGTVVSFRYGFAARAAVLSGHPQVLYGYPVVSVPDEGTGLSRRVTVVDLKVFVCVEQATCTSGGTPALTARVMITDPPWALAGEPEPGKRQIRVLSWAAQR